MRRAGEYGGMPVVKFYWRPSAEELTILNAGGSVELAVLGHTMAPVSTFPQTRLIDCDLVWMSDTTF